MAKKDNEKFTEGFDDLKKSVEAHLNTHIEALVDRAKGQLSGNETHVSDAQRRLDNLPHIQEELDRRRNSGRAVKDPHEAYKKTNATGAKLSGSFTTKTIMDTELGEKDGRGPSRSL